LSPIDRSSRKKIKKLQNLQAHGSFPKTDHILGHKASIYKLKKIEIKPYIISDYKRIKVDLKNKGNNREY
jgi:hypothetical protein